MRVDADRLLGAAAVHLRGSKLPRDVWRAAAALVADDGGRVPLDRIKARCGVSHKTAWRMRALLRDAEALLAEQRAGQRG